MLTRQGHSSHSHSSMTCEITSPPTQSINFSINSQMYIICGIRDPLSCLLSPPVDNNIMYSIIYFGSFPIPICTRCLDLCSTSNDSLKYMDLLPILSHSPNLAHSTRILACTHVGWTATGITTGGHWWIRRLPRILIVGTWGLGCRW